MCLLTFLSWSSYSPRKDAVQCRTANARTSWTTSCRTSGANKAGGKSCLHSNYHAWLAPASPASSRRSVTACEEDAETTAHLAVEPEALLVVARDRQNCKRGVPHPHVTTVGTVGWPVVLARSVHGVATAGVEGGGSSRPAAPDRTAGGHVGGK